MIKLHSTKCKATTISANVLILHRCLPERLAAQDVFRVLSREQLSLLLIPVHVNGNHWCGVVADIKKGVITVFDPQQDRECIEQLKHVVKMVLYPLLPQQERGYTCITFALLDQLDSYNCGVFVIIFYEAKLSGSAISDIGEDTDAMELMQLFWYTYLGYTLP
ncbi:hypothetical protein DVH05_005435 [Phytophthora capsici]|nr:hypothetical protein DVH05_005435 [Phytophthora capsici]